MLNNKYFRDNKIIFFAPVASVMESIVVFPFDSLKVLKQSNQYTTFNSLIRKPNLLYKGFTPFLGQMSMKYLLRFTTFEKLKSKNDYFFQNFLSGICAGISESLFITPFELIKTNLQTTKNKKIYDSILQIYSKNGIKGIYRGFSSTCLRQSTNQAFNFSIYYKLRNKFVKKNEKPILFNIIISSSISSSIGPILTGPVDTIKTRFMNPIFNYKTMKEAYKDILKNEGIKGFYKGIGFRLVRVVGGQIVCFSVIEYLVYITSN